MEPQVLLNRIESLAAHAFNACEPDLAFILAVTAGAFERDQTRQLAASVSELLGDPATKAILTRLAGEAFRLRLSRN